MSEHKGTFWMPEAAATAADHVDWMYDFVYWVSVVSFIGVIGVMTWFVIKYARKNHQDKVTGPVHNTAIEITWTAIPLVVVLAFFFVGFRGFIDMKTVPKDAYEVRVYAQKWSWLFQYPGGYQDTKLIVPKGKPVRLVMSSADVIHSFFVPAFRVKQDIVPGRYTDLWFEATKTGEFNLFCTEYCGTDHSKMITSAVVMEQKDFDEWFKKASDWEAGKSPEEIGKILYEQRGCKQCHSLDGVRGIGPSFKGAFGVERKLLSGESVTMDENYVRQSILNPAGQVVETYAPVMPTFKGKLTDSQVDGLIAYIKSLR